MIDFAEFGRPPIAIAIAGPNGIADSDQSIDRVAMRVVQGGHGVPIEKLRSRFSRTTHNLRAAIVRLPHVIVYDGRMGSRDFRVHRFVRPFFVARVRLGRWLAVSAPTSFQKLS
jgi:predicted ABC-type ATPase